MSLDDPNSVVDNVLTLHSIPLQMCLHQVGVVSASLHAGQQLEILAHEGVSGAGEGGERYLFALVGSSVQEFRLVLKDPVQLLKLSRIF